MTETTSASWLESGYADIVSARRSDSDVEVEFANGDVVVTSATTLGISANDFRLEVDRDEALSIRAVAADGQSFEISWTQIRAATDPDFAQEMRRRDAEESRRLGLRLRALREDRNISQRDLAAMVGMTPPQLSKIESGTFDLRVSTVQTLLRAMNSTFADIAGADVPEVSQRTLRKRAEEAGVPVEVTNRLIAHTTRLRFVRALSRAFGWADEALVAGVPSTPRVSGALRFKSVRAQEPKESPLVNLAYTISLIVREAADVPTHQSLPSDAAKIREQACENYGEVTLGSLLRWMWRSGIPAIPLHGRGGFSAAAWVIGDVPTVVLKESRELGVFWLFDLAHEVGHIARGHITKTGVVDVDSPTPTADSDAQEQEASDFALQLLLPNHEALLDDVRREARGSHLRFKGAVASVAKRAQISPGLLGMIAAYELTEVGEYKDRWGSATNLARPEGAGRPVVQEVAREHVALDRVSDVDATLLRALVLATDDGRAG
jgi:transcriptional regulator with XRE-family HTH domain